MKKVLSLLFLCLSLLSCEFKEEVYLQKNGEGTFNFEADFGKMLSTVGDMTKDVDQKKSNTKLDTIVRFKDLLNNEKFQDSIAKLSKEEQKAIHEMKNYTMRMLMDIDHKKGLLSIQSDFKKINEINNFNEVLTKASALKKGSKQKETPSKYNFKYETTKKSLKRLVVEKELSSKEE